MSTASEPQAARAEHPHLLANYARAPLDFVRGEGCELIDASGDRYLDFVAGIGVCALGHAHPAIAEAVAAQARTLVHCSNLYHHEPAGALANELAELSGFERVFFCNSGTEAIEAAIKLARKHHFRSGSARRTIVACEGGFHGRTLGALAATANPAYREGFEPLPAGFAHVPFDDLAALEPALDERVAAFLVEPVQGEGGVRPASAAYLAAARRLCDERGILLVFDEIQCGMGRSGRLFAFERYGVRPDAVVLAKGLANGLPIGALLLDAHLARALQPGDHGTTFGGSPVPCAAARAHLAYRRTHDLDAHVEAVGATLVAGLAALAHDVPALFGPPRGLGMLLGLPVREPFEAKVLANAARDDERLLLATAAGNVLRVIPPLVLSQAQAHDGLTRLRRVAETASR
ncbi:MAG: aspartate aminotransferase family protein [Vulcanimicrobiaceae bacterium]